MMRVEAVRGALSGPAGRRGKRYCRLIPMYTTPLATAGAEFDLRIRRECLIEMEVPGCGLVQEETRSSSHHNLLKIY